MTNKTGHCHCGAVHFEVTGEPLRMAQCHCNACRRITGTGHNVQAFFRKSDVVIHGMTSTHDSVSDKGNTRTRHFCAVCGSRMFSENSAAPDAIGIAVGEFDDSSWFKPQVILYNAERPAWDPIDSGIDIHEFM
ncbi:MAG: GFA family protein [Hyphomicrobiaceae bacterium]|nr:GFA family protein [Hyphomicrobiaceae bacterium]